MKRLSVWTAVALSAGCSLHSLDYLQNGDSSASNGGRSGADSTAGSGEPGSAGTAPNNVDGGAGGTPAQTSRCDDGALNGDETDRDCGGRACSPCDGGKQCVMGNDCASAICTNQICQPPACTDLARNGDETDVNCGGSCPACSVGRGCQVDSDCESGSCADSVCSIPQCDGEVPDAGCPLLIDNTPYFLHPASAPRSCMDVASLGVNSGAAIQQYTCRGGMNQAFWVVAAGDGQVALRSALSGKCMQVRTNSVSANAAIEQSSCTGQPNQLFLPVLSTGGMKLVVQSSGLSLDVAGSIVSADRQAIVQSVDDGSLDMRWVAEKAAGASFVTLNALGQKDVMLRHTDDVVRAEVSTDADSQWKVLPGLASVDCVSFESRDRPGAYLRQASQLLWSDLSDGSVTFNRDATFCLRAPLSGSDAAYHSLESFSSPGKYITANDGQLKLQTLVDSPEFRQLATWVVWQRQ